MKNIFFASAFLFALTCSSCVYAQDNRLVQPVIKDELYIGYGRATVQEIAAVLTDAIGRTLTTSIFGSSTPSTVTSSGAVNAGYLYHPNRRVAIGLSGTVENIRFSYAGPVRDEKYLFYAVLVNGRLYYMNRPSFSLYSGIGAGYAGAQSSIRGNAGGMFAFQVNALGFRVGRNIAGFGELGFGYQGMLQAGLSVRF